VSDFCPSELSIEERQIRNIVMERTIRNMYGKSMFDVYNEHFAPALNIYVKMLESGKHPDELELTKLLHDKASEINRNFINELGRYMYRVGIWGLKKYPDLSKASYDLMTMCECCHFHTFYTTLFREFNKENERFKVFRINFQLASIGNAYRLTYVDGKCVPMSQEAAFELHRYAKYAIKFVIEGNVKENLSRKIIKKDLKNLLKEYSTFVLTKEKYQVQIDIYYPNKNKRKVMRLFLVRYKDHAFTEVDFKVPIAIQAFPGGN